MRLNSPVKPLTARLQIEPNITPLIDVLLVLLIIFMASLPLTQQGLDLSIPPAPAPNVSAPPTSIVLEYSAEGQVTINKRPVELRALDVALADVFRDRADKTLFISGDGRLRYAQVVDVIDAAKGAGVVRVGVITDAMRRGQ